MRFLLRMAGFIAFCAIVYGLGYLKVKVACR